jgi:hypothetical protein
MTIQVTGSIGRFLSQLDGLLRRKVLTEQEFAKANEVARSQKADLETRKVDLSALLNRARASEAMVERIQKVIKTFVKAFQSHESRQQKAQLQTILKAATVYRDGRIELEFRGSGHLLQLPSLPQVTRQRDSC